MNREEFEAVGSLMSLPADVISKELGIEWLDQKMDSLKCTTRAVNAQLQACTRQKLMLRVREELRDMGCTGLWLIGVYKIWSDEDDCGFLHIVVTGVFCPKEPLSQE